MTGRTKILKINNPWFQGYAGVVAAAVLVCILSGTVVTTNEYRPLYSFGAVHFASGALVGAFFLGLAIWLSFGHERAWGRRVGWFALATVAVEGALGVFGPNKPAVRVAHALLALVLFAISVAIAILTSRTWVLVTKLPSGRLSLRVLAILALLTTLMQGALGVTFRHGVISMMPHVLGALAVAVIVLVLAMTVMYGLEHPVLHSAAVAMLIVTAVQMLLGFLLFSIAFVLQTDPVIVIFASMIHTAAAAVTLAATVVMVLLIWRIVGQSENDRCA